MEAQRLSIKGRVLATDDPQLQDALARVYETPERPRCLCVPGGVEMYVAYHRGFVVKRMPATGGRHHSACPSFEFEAQQSGLGELIGEAVLEREPGRVELRVDFAWTHTTGRSVAWGEPQEVGEIGAPSRRMSLRALMHYLFERAGFNRWSPAMEGRRNQGVLRKYLMEAAQEITVKSVALADRLFVPEPFSEVGRMDAARRRREKLSVLNPLEGRAPMALLVGEYKSSERCSAGRRIWVKHLPDMPLLVSDKIWSRLERRYAALFEARDADGGQRVRIMLAVLLHARREQTYEVNMASMMLTEEHWIPVEGVHELPLLQALARQGRRFIKPLRYDAQAAAAFPNALLLDAGDLPVPLHVVSAFIDPTEQRAKERAIAEVGSSVWVWYTASEIPPLPQAAACGKRTASSGAAGGA